MNAHRPALGIAKGDAEIVLLEDVPQRGRDLLKQAAKVQVADNRVVDFQEESQPVPLLSKLALIRFRRLAIQAILDGFENRLGTFDTLGAWLTHCRPPLVTAAVGPAA